MTDIKAGDFVDVDVVVLDDIGDEIDIVSLPAVVSVVTSKEIGVAFASGERRVLCRSHGHYRPRGVADYD